MNACVPAGAVPDREATVTLPPGGGWRRVRASCVVVGACRTLLRLPTARCALLRIRMVQVTGCRRRALPPRPAAGSRAHRCNPADDPQVGDRPCRSRPAAIRSRSTSIDPTRPAVLQTVLLCMQGQSICTAAKRARDRQLGRKQKNQARMLIRWKFCSPLSRRRDKIATTFSGTILRLLGCCSDLMPSFCKRCHPEPRRPAWSSAAAAAASSGRPGGAFHTAMRRHVWDLSYSSRHRLVEVPGSHPTETMERIATESWRGHARRPRGLSRSAH